MSTSISQPVAADAIEANRFGRFTVLARAGAGAMGTVYAAYDPSLDRRVALKVLRGRATAGSRRAAVRREALALARVTHPNVVPVYEVAESDGRLFIAMEYVDGPPLSAWLTAEQRPWDQVVAHFAELADGLGVAHAQGLIHRDFKPDNVLVGADGRARIIDFGLARALDGDDEGLEAQDAVVHSGEFARLSVALSRTGRLKGTPAYMAPEQLDGEAPTAASDQFSFCVSLFEALTGQAPFARDSLPILRTAIAKGQLASAQGVPKDVLAIVRRGLQADPATRWPSMERLAEALRGALGESAQVVRAWRTQVAVTALLGIFAASAFGALFGEFPRVPADFLLLSGVASTILGLIALFLRFRFAPTPGNRRVIRFVLGLLIVKQAAAVLGFRAGMGVDQLFAADLMVTLGYMWPGGWFLHVDIRAGLLVLLGLSVIGMAHPPAMAFIHSLAMVVLNVAFLRAFWRRARAEAISRLGED